MQRYAAVLCNRNLPNSKNVDAGIHGRMRAAGDILDVCSDFMSRVRCAVHIMLCAAMQLTNAARQIALAFMSVI